jgi:hypothetical protein
MSNSCLTIKKETIMKKAYIIPQVEILEEESQELLATSLTISSDKEVDGSNALGRDYDFEDEGE